MPLSAWSSLTPEEQERRRNLQQIVEEQMLLESEHKYWDAYDRAPDESVPEQDLLKYCIKEMTPMYQLWIDRIAKMRKAPSWVHPLFAVGASKMADITVRCLMQEWFLSSNMKEGSFTQAPPAVVIAESIADLTIQVLAFRTARKEHPDEWRKQSHYIKQWNRRRCNAFARRLNGIVKSSFKRKHRQDFGHNMLRIAEQTGIIKLTLVRRGTKKQTMVSFSDAVLKRLQQKHTDMLSKMALVYRPMIVPPVPHTINASGGYNTTYLRKPVVHRFKDPSWTEVIRKQKSSVPSETVVRGLNALMHTEWAINEKVLDVMEEVFEKNLQWANIPASDFDQFVYTVPYPKEGTKEEQAKWCSDKKAVYDKWFKNFRDRARMIIRLKRAKDLQKLGLFYHVYTCDFRGRGYTASDLLSPQGSDLDRSLLRAAVPVKQTKEGVYWLCVHAANLFGKDKGYTFDQRVKWVKDNRTMFEKIAHDPIKHWKLWVDDKKKKNESFQRLAVAFELCRKDGLTSLVCMQDGTCNGIQHWSCLVRDSYLASRVNIGEVSVPNDLYADISNTMTEDMKACARDIKLSELRKVAARIRVIDKALKKKPKNSAKLKAEKRAIRNTLRSGWASIFLKHWEGAIPRSVPKRPIMTDPYGITFYGIRKYTKTDGHVDWVGKDNVAAAVMEMSLFISEAMGKTLNAANAGKEYLRLLAETASNNGKHLKWTTPCGFKVVHEYYPIESRLSTASLFNKKEMWFGELQDSEIDSDSAMMAVAPNYIHSLDASHMWSVINRMIEAGIDFFGFVHDGYGCLAPFVPLMREYTLAEMHSLHKRNLLNDLKKELETELGVELPAPPKRGDLDIDVLLKSEYAFQ